MLDQQRIFRLKQFVNTKLKTELSALDIEIIGDSNIGDKACQLLLKTAIIREVGLYTPRRIFLAQGFFNDFFQRNKLGPSLTRASKAEDIESLTRNGSFSKEQFDIISKLCASFGNCPLAIRSSGAGDARGTGIYISSFSDNHVSTVSRSLRNILASYFSRSAVAFQLDAHTGEGFGIIVEPIIGQHLDKYLFCPVLSGYGYTSSSQGGSYINAVAGLGGGVDTRDGEKITQEAITAVNGNLDKYVTNQSVGRTSAQSDRLVRSSTLVGGWRYNSWRGRAYVDSSVWKQPSSVEDMQITFNLNLMQDLRGLNLTPFFEMINNLEQRIGTAQYFEWAMTIENHQPKFWITQIADINKQIDVLDFNDLNAVSFSGHAVKGTGDKTCDKIAICRGEDDLDALDQFNGENKNYILLFSGKLTTSSRVYQRQLRYHEFSNASVLLEIPDVHHETDPASHFGGQLEMTGKFFALLNRGTEEPSKWGNLKVEQIQENGLQVYHTKVRIISSERQNKLVGSVLDE